MSSVSGLEVQNTKLYQHFLLIREEIMKHKWIESEKVHHDVGFEYALVDWIVKHKDGWDREQQIK